MVTIMAIDCLPTWQQFLWAWIIFSKEAWTKNCQFKESILALVKSTLSLFSIPLCFVLWPIIAFAITFYRTGRYETASGQKRAQLEKKKRDANIRSARAHILEVC